MARYDVSEHGLLSADAIALSTEEFGAQNDLAEMSLGLLGTDLTDTDEDVAMMAVALQLNFQVEAGVEAYVLLSDSQGARSRSFRDPSVTLHPTALKLVTDLGYGPGDQDWNVLTGVR